MLSMLDSTIIEHFIYLKNGIKSIQYITLEINLVLIYVIFEIINQVI